MKLSIGEKIEKRAYELFLARGGKHGYHIEDWTQAEKEISSEQGKSNKSEEPATSPFKVKVESKPATPKKSSVKETAQKKPVVRNKTA